MDNIQPNCLDAILERSRQKTLAELDDSDRDELMAADVTPQRCTAELHCSVEGYSKVQVAAIFGGKILMLNSRYKPDYYPCKNGDILETES